MTPEVMRMIAEAQERKSDAQKLAEGEMAGIEQARTRAREVRRARLGKQGSRGSDSANRADWTETYRHWDDWEDPEELAEELATKQAREKKRREGRAGTSCNHDHSAERAVFEMEWGDRLLACRDFQNEGNMFFREGQYERAAVRYHHAITYFEYAIAEDEDQQGELDRVRLPVYLNFAACMLKLDRLDEAFNYCEQALRIDPNNVKGLYRRAQVFRKREDFNEARATIQRAITAVDYGRATREAKGIDSGDADNDEHLLEMNRREAARSQQILTLKAELGRIRQGIASYSRNSIRLGRAMFGGGANRPASDDEKAKDKSLVETKAFSSGAKTAVKTGGDVKQKNDIVVFPWNFVSISDASDSEAEDMLLEHPGTKPNERRTC